MVNQTGRRRGGWSAALALSALLAGCHAGNKPRQVTPDDFYAQQQAPVTTSIGGQPGISPDGQRQAAPAPPIAPKSLEIPRAVQSVVQSSAQDASSTRPDASAASTEPASTEPVFATGQYMLLGSLVAKVNATPIYSNKVLRLNATALRNLAREYDLARFEIAARNLIERATAELIDIELEYAAAQTTLDDDEKKQAKAFARLWSEQQISQAGGSIEVVRRQFQARGLIFEEAEQDKYREYAVEIYYYRKVWPMAIVTADDERRYYRAHISEFTIPDKAEIRLICKDPGKEGPQLARDHLNEYRRRALNGEDFAAMAGNYSDLSVHKEQGGYFELEGRHTFALTKVEDAAWTMSPGQISDIIEDNGKYYIVQLLSRQNGGVKPFEDEQIQRAIEDKLQTDLFKALHLANREKLYAESIVSENPQMIDAAVQMAMQNYPRWSKK